MRRLVPGGMLVALVCHLGACTHRSPPRAALLVAAASDLTVAFGGLAAAWVRAGHPSPAVTFGASGLLATQITQGAPFDVFASANVAFVDEVVRSGQCDAHARALYARGRIALCTRVGILAVHGLADLANPDIAHVAIANPEHAPYGRAAREALTAAGLWDTVRPKLVYGENIQQTLQFVQSGNADAAIVSLSQAMHSGLSHTLIDEALHSPLDQAIVACGHGPRADEARAFVRFMVSPAGQSILAQYGFGSPTGATTAPMAHDGGDPDAR